MFIVCRSLRPAIWTKLTNYYEHSKYYRPRIIERRHNCNALEITPVGLFTKSAISSRALPCVTHAANRLCDVRNDTARARTSQRPGTCALCLGIVSTASFCTLKSISTQVTDDVVTPPTVYSHSGHSKFIVSWLLFSNSETTNPTVKNSTVLLLFLKLIVNNIYTMSMLLLGLGPVSGVMPYRP